VFVNGEIVVDGGRLTKVDEKALLAELREAMPAFLAYHEGVEEKNRVLEPYFDAIHRRCNLEDMGVHRLATDQSWTAWGGKVAHGA
jgi:5-methylthioadenosine/S-adenosylhomocysteine deaminase